MGCCSSDQVDFLAARCNKDLSEMILKQKEIIEKEIEHIKEENIELSSFYSSICNDSTKYASRIEDCDFKQNFSEIKNCVHLLYLAVQKNDRTQYSLEKKKLENLISHYDVLEL